VDVKAKPMIQDQQQKDRALPADLRIYLSTDAAGSADTPKGGTD